MTRQMGYLVATVVVLCTLVSAGPTIVALIQAIAPLVVVVGCVAIALRLVWHFTSHY
jgi:hypothetical protein